MKKKLTSIYMLLRFFPQYYFKLWASASKRIRWAIKFVSEKFDFIILVLKNFLLSLRVQEKWWANWQPHIECEEYKSRGGNSPLLSGDCKIVQIRSSYRAWLAAGDLASAHHHLRKTVCHKSRVVRVQHWFARMVLRTFLVVKILYNCQPW